MAGTVSKACVYAPYATRRLALPPTNIQELHDYDGPAEDMTASNKLLTNAAGQPRLPPTRFTYGENRSRSAAANRSAPLTQNRKRSRRMSDALCVNRGYRRSVSTRPVSSPENHRNDLRFCGEIAPDDKVSAPQRSGEGGTPPHIHTVTILLRKTAENFAGSGTSRGGERFEQNTYEPHSVSTQKHVGQATGYDNGSRKSGNAGTALLRSPCAPQMQALHFR